MSTRPGGGVVEAGHQLGHGRLAGSGGADEGHRLAGLDGQVDVLEHGDGRVVAEGDVVEADLARGSAGARSASGLSVTVGSLSSRVRSLNTEAWPCW